MRIADAERYTNHLLRYYKMHDRGWRFEWSRSRTKGGRAVVTRHDSLGSWVKRVHLSRPIVRTNTVAKVRALIVHEVAHAVSYEDGQGLGHGDHWKVTVASMLKYQLMCPELIPQALRVRPTLTLPDGKHRYRCPECGTKTERSRAVRDGYQIGCKLCRTDRGVWVALKKVR